MASPPAARRCLAAALAAAVPAVAQPGQPQQRGGAPPSERQGTQPQQQAREPGPGTAGWFLRHRAACRAALVCCDDDPGRLDATRGCADDRAAQERAFFGAPDLPTTGLGRY